MRKGDLVKLNVEKCFTTRSGGQRDRWDPLGNTHQDELGIVPADRPASADDHKKWREEMRMELAAAAPEDRFCIANDSGGESRLPPRSICVNIHRDDLLVVERARCRVSLGWGNPTPGMAKVMLPNGETAFLKRDLLSVV